MVHTNFLTDYKALQQKGRRIPIDVQEKVEKKEKEKTSNRPSPYTEAQKLQR